MNININGNPVVVDEGVSVAAAIMNAEIDSFRSSVKGFARAPLCGMGICFECRAQIDGIEHERACMVLCREGMKVVVR